MKGENLQKFYLKKKENIPKYILGELCCIMFVWKHPAFGSNQFPCLWQKSTPSVCLISQLF